MSLGATGDVATRASVVIRRPMMSREGEARSNGRQSHAGRPSTSAWGANAVAARTISATRRSPEARRTVVRANLPNTATAAAATPEAGGRPSAGGGRVDRPAGARGAGSRVARYAGRGSAAIPGSCRAICSPLVPLAGAANTRATRALRPCPIGARATPIESKLGRRTSAVGWRVVSPRRRPAAGAYLRANRCLPRGPSD